MEEEHSGLAFYETEPVAARTLETVLGWLESRGVVPAKLGVTAPGFSSKMTSFESTYGRLLRRSFSGLKSFELTGDGTSRDGSAAHANAGFVPDCCFVCASASAAPLPSGELMSLARELVQLLRPQYGIGFRRMRRLGPAAFALGLAYNLDAWGPDLEEAKRINRWGDLDVRASAIGRSILRDVYPWNFLTDAHLSRSIGQLALDEWIRSSPERGSLLPVSNGIVLWEIADSQIPQVRSSLEAEGLLLSPHRS